MPIRPFIDGQSFEPETIKSMSEALAGALAALGLKDKNDDLTIVVAKKIIELARNGEHDPEQLRSAVLKSLRQ
jgi:hypothetical protein